MASVDVNNITPNRKRKRDSEKPEINENICFENAAFSSTPKKNNIGKRRLLPILPIIKDQYSSNSCMEVKSIAELVQNNNERKLPDASELPFNPYEVQRKPPKNKKLKKDMSTIEEACFENPALNLDLPEKQFNPFEVVRDAEKCQEDQRKCFVNEALNIKSQDTILTVRNPFEIERENNELELKTKSPERGIENHALDDAFKPTNFTLGIPFTPTVGCRIDFNNVLLSKLTPSKLLLAEKLVFSPVPNNAMLPKRSLDAISEESSSMSIGKELDRYQLELENSINEAKLRKNVDPYNERVEEECVYQLQLKVERRGSLNHKLPNISESEEYEFQEEIVENIISTEKNEINSGNISKRVSIETCVKDNDAARVCPIEPQEVESAIQDDAIVESDGEDNESVEFKAPPRFVRSYRRDIAPSTKITKNTEALKSNDSSRSSTECVVEQKSNGGVKNAIRKSIRRMISHHKHHQENIDPTILEKETAGEKDCDAKPNTIASHIFSSIRHSLRRKPKPVKEVDNSRPKTTVADISIIDCTERTLKLKSSASQNEYIRIEELTNERRHNSLRRSTREVRQQVMKTLFQHKHEEYSFRN